MKNVLSLLKFSSVFTIVALALTATSVALGQKQNSSSSVEQAIRQLDNERVS